MAISLKNVDRATKQLHWLNEDEAKRLIRQNWLDYFGGTAFLEVHKQPEFLDAVLIFLKNHKLEDWILKDFCRAFNIKQVSSNLELRNSHEFYRYMVSLRGRLLDKVDDQKNRPPPIQIHIGRPRHRGPLTFFFEELFKDR